jgi:hypothetical protein
LLVVLFVGCCTSVVAMRRRADRYRRAALEYAEWHQKLSQVIAAMDDTIQIDRKFVALDEQAMGILALSDDRRLARSSSRLEQRLAIRSRAQELQEYARQQERDHSEAADRPWKAAPFGKPIGPTTEALIREFFADDAAP